MKLQLLLLIALPWALTAQTNAPAKPKPRVIVVRPAPAPVPATPIQRLYADPLWRMTTNRMAQIDQQLQKMQREDEVKGRQNRLEENAGVKRPPGFYMNNVLYDAQRQRQRNLLRSELAKLTLRLENRAQLYGTNVPGWLVNNDGHYMPMYRRAGGR